MPEIIPIHKDRELFREALSFTATQTGFSQRLIEKDYFCSVLLAYLADADGTLVFKGGTCLAKVHADFYRLSEDMDFALPMSIDASRAQRSAAATPIKNALNALRTGFDGTFRMVEPVKGANNSRQYNAMVGYTSLLTDSLETISIEVSLREPLLTAEFEGLARTGLLDPVSGRAIVGGIRANCISKVEAFAEKLRAALSRRDVAVRDFFDIDYAVRRLGLRCLDEELLALLRKKLAVPGNDPVDVSESRLQLLRPQLEARLKPVLRKQDLDEFDLDRAWGRVTEVAQRLAGDAQSNGTVSP
ncbi:MAG: nucleotidyl transferase AbiEii/AbiGii toxin family protein [Planctomycetes bacterium]|nr:nucleotidyl transferase AbiEii/AbiGii toxin family protein [Planctomycetota bacterium]